MDWNDVNLDDNYEKDQNILDPYNFDTLLLEIHCNLKELTKEEIKKHFDNILKNKVETAKEIFAANLDNILKKSIQDRKE